MAKARTPQLRSRRPSSILKCGLLGQECLSLLFPRFEIVGLLLKLRIERIAIIAR